MGIERKAAHPPLSSSRNRLILMAGATLPTGKVTPGGGKRSTFVPPEGGSRGSRLLPPDALSSALALAALRALSGRELRAASSGLPPHTPSLTCSFLRKLTQSDIANRSSLVVRSEDMSQACGPARYTESQRSRTYDRTFQHLVSFRRVGARHSAGHPSVCALRDRMAVLVRACNGANPPCQYS